jgi:EAL domain-containing protein (putative c-di-GMP-specific phosphodiesterase class I)
VHGLIAPDVFLPLAEQSYLMRDITHQVVDSALAQSARWRAAGLPVQISVNVSARDLLDSGLSDAIGAGLVRHDVPPGAFQLEITERVLMTEPTHGVAPVDSLARLGISLALDDFGTGYSSLARLKRLPVDEVKIDSSFVGRLLDGGDDTVIVRSLVEMVRALGMRSVAEGVETEAIASRLAAMGCDAAQGWYFGRPMDSASATSWLMHRFDGDRPGPGGDHENGAVTSENKPSA